MTVVQRAVDHWKAARWWIIHSRESKLKAQCRQFSKNLQLLSIHMLANPTCYEVRGNNSDWEIYQKEKNR